MNINKLKSELIAQRKSKFKGNIYHYSQVNFAYNSNKIEGGRLTEDETEECKAPQRLQSPFRATPVRNEPEAVVVGQHGDGGHGCKEVHDDAAQFHHVLGEQVPVYVLVDCGYAECTSLKELEELNVV